MEPSELSGSESLTTRTTRSTKSMEVDVLSIQASPSRSDTPIVDTQDSSSTDAEKGIIVDAPAIKAPTVGLIETAPILLGRQVQAEEGDGWSSSEPPSPVQNTPVNASQGVKRKRPGHTHLSVPFKRVKKAEVHGAFLGVWSGSDEPDDADKHVVYGFLDVDKRLRLRIHHMNRRGEELIGNAPAGAGGCWVKFGDIIFEDHLKGMTKDQIHEYVLSQPDTLAERADTSTRAALTARAHIPGHAAATAGPVIQRAELRRPSRFTPVQTISRSGTPGARFQGSVNGHNAVDMGSPSGSQSADQGRSDVLLGVWKPSNSPNDADKHTVWGSITTKGQIRAKIQRVTRDGRFVDGNFPVGPGQLWLAVESDDIGFESHLDHLDRNVVKEYVRIRSLEQRPFESQQQRQAGEIDAVRRAQQIVADASRNGPPSNPITNRVYSSHGSRGSQTRDTSEVPGLRRARRSDHVQLPMQQAGGNAMRASNSQAEARKQQEEKVRIAAAARVAEAARTELRRDMRGLNKIWVAQEAAGSEVRHHNGIQYSRKPNGPLVGKLVSPGTLINIDGEDFVEYRVLTRPF